MSLGLLAVYSDSSDDEDEDGRQPEPKLGGPCLDRRLLNPFRASEAATALPSFMVEPESTTATSAATTSSSSVFSNPFLAKEERAAAVLEQHVSMTERLETRKRTSEGKKVCFNFRKGRCRFGHKCTFAHDTDLKISKTTPVSSKEDVVAAKTMAAHPICANDAEQQCFSDSNQSETAAVIVGDGDGVVGASRKKNRPGLSDAIMPSKKAMKFHHKVYHG